MVKYKAVAVFSDGYRLDMTQAGIYGASMYKNEDIRVVMLRVQDWLKSITEVTCRVNGRFVTYPIHSLVKVEYEEERLLVYCKSGPEY